MTESGLVEDTMNALSLKQPWATIVARGLQPIENRKWRLPARMFGADVALQASLTWDKDGEIWIRQAFHDDAMVMEAIEEARAWCGVILCVVQVHGELNYQTGEYRSLNFNGVLASCGPLVKKHPLIDNPWFFGPYGFVLGHLRTLATPVPHRGHQGIRPLPETVDAAVRAQLGATP